MLGPEEGGGPDCRASLRGRPSCVRDIAHNEGSIDKKEGRPRSAAPTISRSALFDNEQVLLRANDFNVRRELDAAVVGGARTPKLASNQHSSFRT